MTSDEFEKLLSLLDPDRERAGQRYVTIRRILVKFFQWNHCYPEEDLADKVLDRIAHRLGKGMGAIENPIAFIRDVAKNVRSEFYKKPRAVPLEDLPPRADPQATHAESMMIRESEDRRRWACLHECIQGLTKPDRRLFLAYEFYSPVSKETMQLAEKLSVPLKTLRVRAHRIKHRVEKCFAKCFYGIQSAAHFVD